MSTVLDVAIGVSFLFLLLALVVTTIQELIATVFAFRANALFDTLKDMLQGGVEVQPASSDESGNQLPAKLEPIIDRLYAHPLIKNLCRDVPRFGKSLELPSYIPSKAFALALLDVLRGDRTLASAVGASKVLAGAAHTLNKVENEELRHALGLLVRDIEVEGNKLDAQAAVVSQRVETWFNDRMARASGWYKRRMQKWAFSISLLVTFAANADSIHVATELWKDGSLRNAVVASAQAFHGAQLALAAEAPAPPRSSAAAELPAASVSPAGQAPPAGPPLEKAATRAELRSAAGSVVTSVNQLQNAKFPIGWGRQVNWAEDWALVALGWLVTALAVSLGSGFWFDILGKVLQVRGSGTKVSTATGRVESHDG